MYYLCSENKGVISFAVTAKLICAFVFDNADCLFSHAAAHKAANDAFENVKYMFIVYRISEDMTFKSNSCIK